MVLIRQMALEKRYQMMRHAWFSTEPLDRRRPTSFVDRFWTSGLQSRDTIALRLTSLMYCTLCTSSNQNKESHTINQSNRSQLRLFLVPSTSISVVPKLVSCKTTRTLASYTTESVCNIGPYLRCPFRSHIDSETPKSLSTVLSHSHLIFSR